MKTFFIQMSVYLIVAAVPKTALAGSPCWRLFNNAQQPSSQFFVTEGILPLNITHLSATLLSEPRATRFVSYEESPISSRIIFLPRGQGLQLEMQGFEYQPKSLIRVHADGTVHTLMHGTVPYVRVAYTSPEAASGIIRYAFYYATRDLDRSIRNTSMFLIAEVPEAFPGIGLMWGPKPKPFDPKKDLNQ